MSELPEQSKLTRSASLRCLTCGQYAPADAKVCPTCGRPFASRILEADELTGQVLPTKAPTLKLSANDPTAKLRLLPDASVILQFLPTGACISLTLERAMILGRGTGLTSAQMLDVSGFQGLLYGVSRQHCKLERRGDRLYVADLGSTNGTYCNNKRLLPFQDQAVGHGDRLIIGALHVIVRFSTQE
jgi:hypothetical protein